MNRRHFLQSTLLLSAGLCCSQLFAAAQSAPKLLVVFLRGGYDGASLLVPTGCDFYYEKRPNIAIPRAGKASAKQAAALPLDGDYGLHPMAGDILLPLYQARQLAFVPFCGSQNQSRSHFEAQDVIELGHAGTALTHKDYASGMLYRLARVLSRNHQAGGVSFTESLALAFKGEVPIPNLPLKATPRAIAQDAQMQVIEELYKKQALAKVVEEGFAARNQAAAILAKANIGSNDAKPASAFEQEMQRVAMLMKENLSYSVGFIDVGDWDTHVNQGGSSGSLANSLTNLSKGLVSFKKSMDVQWANTVVVVLSEFGRTFAENGNRGTDHGHGNTLWVLGGALQGGKLAGNQVALGPGTLHEQRDLPVLNDYRSVLSYILVRLYSLSQADIQEILPGAKWDDYGFI